MRIHGSGHSMNRDRDGKRILFVRKKTVQRMRILFLAANAKWSRVEHFYCARTSKFIGITPLRNYRSAIFRQEEKQSSNLRDEQWRQFS